MPTTPTQVDRTVIRGLRRTISLLLLAFVCTGPLRGDRVELRTGEVFFGKILRANRREVSMRLESGGIVSFRMNQVAFFRKNFVASDEWIPSPVLVVDDPTLDINTEPDTSFQGSPSVPVEPEEPVSAGLVIAPATDLDPSLVRPAIDGRGFRVSPPRGFLDWEESSDSLLKRFYDPVTQADLDIVDLGSADESLESIKRKTSHAHARNAATGLRVLRDERVAEATYKGWYFEFQEDLNGVNVRRVWLFARTGRRTLLLKYSCPERHYEEFRRPFGESIRSFSVVATGDVVSDSAGSSQTDRPRSRPEENVDPAEELLRLLRRNRDADKSRKAIDEYLNRPDDR